jgi:hypothetical protein
MEIRFLDHDIATWIRPREIPPRSDGRHVSEVVVGMLKAAAPRKFEQYGKDPGTERVPRWEVGYLWEDVLSAALRERVELPAGFCLMPPLEIKRGHLFGTPDRVLYNPITGALVLEELKSTWMSAKGLREDPHAINRGSKFQYWLLQAKTYAAMLLHYAVVPPILNETDQPAYTLWPCEPGEKVIWIDRRVYYPIAEPPPLHVRALFLNGDYRGEQALPLCWEIRWTRDELEMWFLNVTQWIARCNYSEHHEWSNSFGDDWTPERGTPCDCGARVWVDGHESPTSSLSEAEYRALTRGDFPPTVPQE